MKDEGPLPTQKQESVTPSSFILPPSSLFHCILSNVLGSIRAFHRVLQQQNDLGFDVLPSSPQRTSCCITVAAASKTLSDFGDVDVTFGSQARPVNSWFTFLQHCNGFDFFDSERVIHKTIGIFIRGFRLPLHLESLTQTGNVTSFISSGC